MLKPKGIKKDDWNYLRPWAIKCERLRTLGIEVWAFDPGFSTEKHGNIENRVCPFLEELALLKDPKLKDEEYCAKLWIDRHTEKKVKK